jgi:hypothetical protein
MSDSAGKDPNLVAEIAKPRQERDDHMEDEEKIIAGRNDVNYPALLTKDVPGG